MSEFLRAPRPGIRFYRWLDRLFAPRRRVLRAVPRPLPPRSLYIADGGSF